MQWLEHGRKLNHHELILRMTQKSHLQRANSYSELGCMRPVSGGEKEYLDYAYPKLRGVLSFMFTQTCVFLVRPGAAAAVSVAFGQYIMYALVGRKEMLKQNGYDYLEDSYEWLARGLGVFW